MRAHGETSPRRWHLGSDLSDKKEPNVGVPDSEYLLGSSLIEEEFRFGVLKGHAAGPCPLSWSVVSNGERGQEKRAER